MSVVGAIHAVAAGSGVASSSKKEASSLEMMIMVQFCVCGCAMKSDVQKLRKNHRLLP